MDLGNLNVAAAANEGYVLELLHPIDKTILPNDDGSPMTITVVGKYSDQYKLQSRKLTNQRLKANIGRRKAATVTAEQLESESAETAAKCTVAWNITLGGQKPALTPEAAFKLYSDPSFSWLLEQVAEAIEEDTNFTKTS